jgi:hypothetical protein
MKTLLKIAGAALAAVAMSAALTAGAAAFPTPMPRRILA